MKRDAVKYVRDKAKARYVKGFACEICGTSENLELHHLHSLTSLLNAWGYEDIVKERDAFIAAHEKELYEDVVTLCKQHHDRLHQVFGKTPTDVEKQKRWITNAKSNKKSTFKIKPWPADNSKR